MGKTAAKQTAKPSQRKEPPARSLEARENQMIALAVDLAEQQLRDGTASSQVITHYLKLGSTREKIEQRNKELDTELKAAKAEAIRAAERIEDIYAEAIASMKRYAGE